MYKSIYTSSISPLSTMGVSLGCLSFEMMRSSGLFPWMQVKSWSCYLHRYLFGTVSCSQELAFQRGHLVWRPTCCMDACLHMLHKRVVSKANMRIWGGFRLAPKSNPWAMVSFASGRVLVHVILVLFVWNDSKSIPSSPCMGQRPCLKDCFS